jgi:hypothetical protein
MLFGTGWFLDSHHRLLLRAAFSNGDSAVLAWQQWRNSVRLDDIDYASYRVIPILVQTAMTHGIVDPEMPRMKGIMRHTWLRNMLRVRSLAEALGALTEVGIEALVLKGAALFARYPHLAMIRGAGDYDIMVRREDAARAAGALVQIGFQPQVMRVDRFQTADFDKIHGTHFVKDEREGSLDLHWCPLPKWTDHRYIDEMFAHGEAGMLAGRAVRVPSLADHLFLTVARPEPWQSDEVLLRAVETTLILRGCSGSLDWNRFVFLANRFSVGAKARLMLRLVREATDTAVPDHALRALGYAQALSAVGEVALSRLPQTAVLRMQTVILTQTKNARLRRWINRARNRKPVIEANDKSLERIWRARSQRCVDIDRHEPIFLEGFSFPEEAGRWTDGGLAVLVVPIDATSEGHVAVRLTALPFCAPGANTSVFDVCVGPNSTTRRSMHFKDGVPAAFAADRAMVLEAPTRIVIVLRPLDAAAPAMFNLSDDVRLLGLMIQRVEIIQPSSVTTFDLAVSRRDPPAL